MEGLDFNKRVFFPESVSGFAQQGLYLSLQTFAESDLFFKRKLDFPASCVNTGLWEGCQVSRLSLE